MSKVLLYARVSTDNQTTGLEAQVLALKRYCALQGIDDYELYSDEGVSGAKTSRPGLDLMMNRIQEVEVSKVVTYSLSRLSRSTSHLLHTLEVLKGAEVGFVSITENIDLNTPAGRMMVTILGAVAELERSLVVERVKCGLSNARSKGKVLGAPKKFHQRDLFVQLFNQSLSYREIAKLIGCSASTVCRELKNISKTKVA